MSVTIFWFLAFEQCTRPLHKRTSKIPRRKVAVGVVMAGRLEALELGAATFRPCAPPSSFPPSSSPPRPGRQHGHVPAGQAPRGEERARACCRTELVRPAAPRQVLRGPPRNGPWAAVRGGSSRVSGNCFELSGPTADEAGPEPPAPHAPRRTSAFLCGARS